MTMPPTVSQVRLEAAQETSLLEAMHTIPSPGQGIELELPEREESEFESRIPDDLDEKST